MGHLLGCKVGLQFEDLDVFTEVAPNQRITERSASALASTCAHTFEPDGTRTKWTLEHHPQSFWRIPPLCNLTDLTAGRMSDSFMPQLKDTLETSSV